MTSIELYNKVFQLGTSDLEIIPHPVYNTLQIRQGLSELDREIALLSRLSELIPEFDNTLMVNHGSSHAGIVPIALSGSFKQVIIIENNLDKVSVLKQNIESTSNVCIQDKIISSARVNLLRIEDTSYLDYKLLTGTPILLWSGIADIEDYQRIPFITGGKFLYVPKGVSIRPDWDNLLCVVLMVKNACGNAEAERRFIKMLEINRQYMDYWIVLDTGSTDATVEIVRKVLYAVPGELHQEPFINFRESRNRSLELAGEKCRFIVVLDDTYTLQGNVREFLHLVRGDTFSHSFSLQVTQSDGTISYGSNRLLRSEKKLRYKYRIHEIIEPNVNVGVPMNEMFLLDTLSDYMKERTSDRKDFDLQLLFETWEDDKNDPRTLYYIAQTYTCMKKWPEAYDFFNRRIIHPVKGYLDEYTDAHYEKALIAENYLGKEWSECHQLYLDAYKVDNRRAETLFCIADHYIRLKIPGGEKIAYMYLRQAWDTDTSSIQVSARKFLYDYHIPCHLMKLCYAEKNYALGKQASRKVMDFVGLSDATAQSWNNIYSLLEQGVTSITHSDKAINQGKYTVVYCVPGGYSPWNGETISVECLGGSETHVILFAEEFVKQGKEVIVYCMCSSPGTINGVLYQDIKDFPAFILNNRVDHCIISRFADYAPLVYQSPCPLISLLVHDVNPIGEVIITDPRLQVICLTTWHQNNVAAKFPVLTNYIKIWSNGIIPFPPTIASQHPIFIYSSMPNRGLIHLLNMFGRIKAIYPEAILHVFADTKQAFVQEICPEEMKQVDIAISQPGVINHGRVSQSILREYWVQASIWLYPCTWSETFCITALEAQASRTLCITNDLAALKETVGDRGIIIPGDVSSIEWQDLAIRAVVAYIDRGENSDLEPAYKWAQSKEYSKLALTML